MKEKKSVETIHEVGSNHVHPDFKNLGKVGHHLQIGKAKPGKIKLKK